MTARELSQLYYLVREIELDKERLATVRAKAEGPAIAALTDAPPVGGNESRVERNVIEMIGIEGVVESKQEQIAREIMRLERFIACIPDSVTRTIFTLRFARGFSWREVAETVGGGNTEHAVKRRRSVISKKIETRPRLSPNVPPCRDVLCYIGIG